MISLLSHPFLTLFLSTIAPVAAFVSVNMHFFSTRQVVNSIAIALMSGSLAGFVATFLCSVLDAALPLSFSFSAAFACLVALGILFSLSGFALSEILPQEDKRRRILLFVALGASVFSAFFSLGVVNALLAVYTFLSLYDLYKNRNVPKERIYSYVKRERQTFTTDTQLRYKPNIYVLFLESYQRDPALSQIYGFTDNFTDRFLQKNGFTVYPDTFSNGHTTLTTTSSLLSCRLLSPEQNSESSYALNVLKGNGYKCELYDHSEFIFNTVFNNAIASIDDLVDHTSFSMSRFETFFYDAFGPLPGMSNVLRKVLNIEKDPFETTGKNKKMFEGFFKRVAKPDSQPAFRLIRFGAKHIPVSGLCPAIWSDPIPDWKKKYCKVFSKAKKQLKQVALRVIKEDPNAIIVIFGDHGARSYHYLLKQKPKNVKLDAWLDENGVSTEQLALDFFCVPLAIRWPDDISPPSVSRMTHVNIFRYLFKAMGGHSAFLDQTQPDISILPGNYIAVKNGRPLDRLYQCSKQDIKAMLNNDFAFLDKICAGATK